MLPSLNYNIPLITEQHLSQKLINIYVFNDDYWVGFLIFLFLIKLAVRQISHQFFNFNSCNLTCDFNPDERSIIILPKFTVLVKFKLFKIEFQ